MNEIEQILENISKDIYNRFNQMCKMDFFHIINPLENVLAVNIIFKRKKDLEKFQKNASGTQKKIMAYLNEKLEETGKWRLSEVDLKVEMDSKESQEENIKKRRNNIPSEEDFARAEAAMREKNKGLSETCDQIKKRFKKNGVHEVYMFYDSDTNDFGAYIFYRWEHQIKEAEKSGLSSRIKNDVFEELEKAGRGSKEAIKVNFEIDSHENVEKNYEGDYYNRLR